MRVTFTGTGAAGGVPRYGCDCAACQRALQDRQFVRRPCSALIETDTTRVLLDAGLMDLHERFAPGTLDAIVLTHYHADHVQGLFHLRWGKGLHIDVFGPPDSEGCADLRKHPGILAFHDCHKFEAFAIGDLRFTPLPLIHSKPTLGYAIESADGARFAYLTDTLGLPPKTEAFLRAWHAFDMAIDCSHPPRDDPGNHNDWHAALLCAEVTGARTTWLTHIGHELDCWRNMQTSVESEHVRIARDGMQVHIPGGAR